METSKVPVEVTTRYVTNVDDLAQAWAFVMDRLDKVGPDPRIEISPTWMQDFDAPVDESWSRHFSVVVEGMVEEKP